MHAVHMLKPHVTQRDPLPLRNLCIRQLDNLCRHFWLLCILHVLEPERRAVDEQLDLAGTLTGLSCTLDHNGPDTHSSYELQRRVSFVSGAASWQGTHRDVEQKLLVGVAQQVRVAVGVELSQREYALDTVFRVLVQTVELLQVQRLQ